MDQNTLSHLRGIVAIWLTNGNQWVESGNDTRYDFYPNGYIEAANATQTLYEREMIECRGGAPEDSGDLHCKPTPKGVYTAMSGMLPLSDL